MVYLSSIIASYRGSNFKLSVLSVGSQTITLASTVIQNLNNYSKDWSLAVQSAVQ